MKRLFLIGLPLAVLAACGGTTKKTCKETGCSAGSVCNTNSGACEAIAGGGGGSTGGGGGSTGGGGGSTGGGGGSTDAGFDAGVVVDPFDDGGTFVPGDICTYAIPVVFGADGGLEADGGPVQSATLTVDLSAAEDQYRASCNASTSDSKDLLFKVTLTEPRGLIVSATDLTPGQTQDAVLSLVASPCASFAQTACFDSGNDPEVMTIERLPAGTWYVLLENYGATGDESSYDVQFDLVEPVPGPANDGCSMAQPLTFANDTATASGTTVGAFNDTGGAALSCSTGSARNPEVFYSFTLTAPHDVQVALTTPSGSNLTAALAITNVCGGAGRGVERGCDTGSSAQVRARSVPAGTYFIVVDGDYATTGAFELMVTLSAPTPAPANDTCATPTPLATNASQMVDANAAAADYALSCSPGSGGDVVYTFTTTMAQKATLTATGMNGADAIISLRGAPCDMDTAEVGCIDDNGSISPEVLIIPNLPAGTYFVVLQAYSATAGEFGLSLALDAAVPPPANDTCTAPATLVDGVAQTVDVAAATQDYTADCSAYGGGDVVYQFTTTAAQKVVVTATGTGGADAVLELRSAACDPGTLVHCSNSSGSTSPEVLSVNNLPAGTYYVLLGSDGSGTQFSVQLALSAPVPPPANDTCTTPDVVTGTMATRSVDLTDAAADIDSDLCATTADGQDVVYEVSIPAGQTLTVVGTPPSGSNVDAVLFVRSPTCAMTTSEGCVDMTASGGVETLLVGNTTGATKVVFVVVKAYRVGNPGSIDLTFTLQ